MKKPAIKCPRCGTETAWQDNPSRPFCSESCRLVDLGRWAAEDYKIPGSRQPHSDDEQTSF